MRNAAIFFLEIKEMKNAPKGAQSNATGAADSQ